MDLRSARVPGVAVPLEVPRPMTWARRYMAIVGGGTSELYVSPTSEPK